VIDLFEYKIIFSRIENGQVAKNNTRQAHSHARCKEMLRCPACGTMNMDNSTLCKKCRQPLQDMGVNPLVSVPPPEKRSSKELIQELRSMDVVGREAEDVTAELLQILRQADLPMLIDRYPANDVSDAQKFLAEVVDEKRGEMEMHIAAPLKDAELLILLGGAAYLLGDYQKALERFSAAVQLDRADPLPEYNRAMTLLSLEKYDDAIDSFTRAITLKPDFEQAWANKGRALVAQGHGKEALEYFERALCLDRNDPEAWFEKGVTEEEMGQFEEALRCLDTALKLRPDFVQAWNYKGDALFHMGKPDEALKAYSSALKVRPHDFEAWNNMGIVLFSQKDLEKALDAFNKALMIRTESDDAWLNKGTVLEMSGNPEEALACYDRALRLNPECEPARKAREKLYSLGLSSVH
jgi:tetratricopeptide (TPR) repeat protein